MVKRNSESSEGNVKTLSERSPFKTLEVVDRPRTRGRQKWEIDEEVELVAKTLASGKAVKLEPRSMMHARNGGMALRHAVERIVGEEVRMRGQKMGDYLICWAEKVSKKGKR